MIINRVHVHASITVDRVVELVERRATSLDNPGLCILCGTEAEGVEPDAERYPCEACEAETTVYGAEQLLLYMVA